MPESEALCKRVKSVRISKNETQLDFAMHCGVSEDVISNIENCKANPTLTTLQNISAYIGCTVSDLLKVD